MRRAYYCGQWHIIRTIPAVNQPKPYVNTQSAGKRVWASRDSFWFYTWLDDKVASLFWIFLCVCVKQNNMALSYQGWTRCRGRGQGGSNDWVSPSSMYASPIRPGLLSTTNQIAACKGKWHVRTFHILIIKLPSSFSSLCRSSYSCIGIISTFPILHLLGLSFGPRTLWVGFNSLSKDHSVWQSMH